MARVLIVSLTLFLSACVPNEHLAQACRDEPANWRRQVVMADTVLTADLVNLLEPRLTWTHDSGRGVQPSFNPCASCIRLLEAGFPTIEYLPTSSTSLDRVWRYSLADAGDPRCEFNVSQFDPPPTGKCLAVERDVARSAQYALHLFIIDTNAHGVDVWTFELVDLVDRAVVAHATALTQTGWETPMYGCEAVHADQGHGRDQARDFVEGSIQPRETQD